MSAALAFHAAAVAERDAAVAAGNAGDAVVLPRYEVATRVDLAKALPDCPVCRGGGVARVETREELVRANEGQPVPVVCDCVVRNGGVPEDPLRAHLLRVAALKEKNPAAYSELMIRMQRRSAEARKEHGKTHAANGIPVSRAASPFRLVRGGRG